MVCIQGIFEELYRNGFRGTILSNMLMKEALAEHKETNAEPQVAPAEEYVADFNRTQR